MVEVELGVPFEDVYELVEPEPIAAASIGQASFFSFSVLCHMLVPSCSGRDSVLKRSCRQTWIDEILGSVYTQDTLCDTWR